MSRKLSAYLYLAMAALLLLLAGLTLLAMLQALAVSTTLVAIESAFGSFVLCVLLLLGAGKLKQAGLTKLKAQACGASAENRQ